MSESTRRGSGSAPPAKSVFHVPSDIGEIERVVDRAVGCCAGARLDRRRLLFNFRVGLTEAISNAILYGNANDLDRRVRVELLVEPGEVCARVTDEGHGFDPGAVPDPRLPENIPKPAGRGIFLMQALMDEVRFNAAGNSVTLILRGSPDGLPGQRHAGSGTTLRPLPPEPVAATLLDFREGLGLDVRAWRIDGRDRIPVFPEGARDVPDSAGHRFRIDSGDGSVIEVQVDGHGPDSPVGKVLEATLGRACGLARQAARRGAELSERREEIGLLYSISETLASILHLDEAARRILEEVSRVLGAKRGSLWVHSPDDDLLRLAASVGGGQLREWIPVADETSITARAFRAEHPIMAAGDEMAGPDTGGSPASERESWLSVPVRYTPHSGAARTVGVLNLIGRRRHEEFTPGDQRLMVAVANQIGAALETNRLIRESMARERVSREMELAHNLQMKLLPPVPSIPGVEAAARVLPTASVGGDFYQVLQLSGGRIGVMIGDVSGHGFPAALIMALVMSAAAIYAEEGAGPATVLEHLDRAIGDELESTEMFLSLCYCVLSQGGTEITYSNAGHPHAFVVEPGGAAHRLLATDPPMGIGAAPYGESTVPWTPGEDLLLLFTDGLSDTLAQLRRKSGEELVLRTVAGNHRRPVSEILHRLFEMSVQAIPSMPSDDRTAVVLRTT